MRKNPSRSALIVLSPLAPEIMDRTLCAAAATSLKARHIERADLTMDPRAETPASLHRLCRPLPAFNSVALALSQQIFGPVVGKSCVRDLEIDTSAGNPFIAPDLKSLSQVGTLFTKSTSIGAPSESIGRDLGFVFYAAIHARTPEREPYSHLVFPTLTPTGIRSLHKFDAQALGENLGGFGTIIDLDEMRRKIGAVMAPKTAASAADTPKPRYLN